MKIVHGLDSADLKLSKSVLSIGNFDGVHRGHQQLVTQGGLLAANEQAPFVVLTFEPHPLDVVRPGGGPKHLSTLNDKLDLLADAGADITVVATSTPQLLGMEAERFIRTVVDIFHPVHILEGPTFGFGRGRRGTPEVLQELGRRWGFGVCIIEPVRLQIEEGELVPVSSSVIRQLIDQGKVHRAALCLGRPYMLSGEVVSGDGRGAEMGFPTANVDGIEQMIPADGVYAGALHVGGKRTLAGISIGTNPTFGGSDRKVEAHLIDFAGRLTGQSVGVELGIWLRLQRRFQSPQDLADQIANDIEAVKAWARDGGAEHQRYCAS